MIKKDDPFIYRSFIKQFREAYFILKDKYPLPVDLFFVKAFLLGRIIELILKTELIMKGQVSSVLRKKTTGGHDLVKLFKLLGYPDNYSVNPTTYESIRHLNLFYGDKKYEYPQHEVVEIKNVGFLEAFIDLSTKKIDFHLSSKAKP